MCLFFSFPFLFCLNHIWWIFGNFHETYFWQIPHHKVWLFRLWNWALIFQKTKMQYLTKRTSSRSRWVWNIHQLIFYCQNISFPCVRYVMEHTSYRRQGCKGLKTCNKLQKGIVLQKLRLFFQLNFTVEVRSEIRSHICASRFPLKKRLFFHLLNVTRQRSRRRRRLHILIRLQNDMRGHAKRSGSLLSSHAVSE